jgi:hypothetical protein
MVDLPTITVRDTAVSGVTADVNLTTLLGPLNFEVDGTEVWAPGEVKSVSGISGTLTAGGGQGTIATGVKITGGSTVNEVSFPAYTALAVDLRWGPTAATLNTTLQEYRSKRAYTARTVSRVGGWTSMNLGYGFAHLSRRRCLGGVTFLSRFFVLICRRFWQKCPCPVCVFHKGFI